VYRLLICVLVASALASCGSGDSKTPTSDPPPSDPQATTADLTPYAGIHVATIKKAELVREGAAGRDAPGGTWTLSIAQTDPDLVRVEPAGFDLRATRLSNGRVTFAPNTVCPYNVGRTKTSVYRIEKTSIGIRFVVVKRGCVPDAAPLILGHWRRA
jgi:hypothetical protein